jgi:hypothetical protein
LVLFVLPGRFRVLPALSGQKPPKNLAFPQNGMAFQQDFGLLTGKERDAILNLSKKR